MNDNTKQVIIVPANPTEPPASPEAEGFLPLLVGGGVLAVVVIYAMSHFSQTQLKSVGDLLNILNKKRK